MIIANILNRRKDGPAGVVMICECKREVWCEGMTTECECGRLFNWAGQKLAPRSQWEEDREAV